jgi:thioredoxin 1
MMMEMVFTTQNFEQEVLKSDKPVLVDFYADWCGPCKMMAPVVEELAELYQGKAKVGKLNVDDNEEIAMKYGVMSIPTLLIIKNGNVEAKMIGVQKRETLMDALDKAL